MCTSTALLSISSPQPYIRSSSWARDRIAPGRSASQAPGGLGVFDSAFLLLLPKGTDMSQAVAALLAFRVLYYLLPLLLALVGLALRWLVRRRG